MKIKFNSRTIKFRLEKEHFTEDAKIRVKSSIKKYFAAVEKIMDKHDEDLYLNSYSVYYESNNISPYDNFMDELGVLVCYNEDNDCFLLDDADEHITKFYIALDLCVGIDPDYREWEDGFWLYDIPENRIEQNNEVIKERKLFNKLLKKFIKNKKTEILSESEIVGIVEEFNVDEPDLFGLR